MLNSCPVNRFTLCTSGGDSSVEVESDQVKTARMEQPSPAIGLSRVISPDANRFCTTDTNVYIIFP